MVYYRLGQWKEAADTLQASAQTNPEGPSAYDLFFLAMAYRQTGQPAKAKDCYDQAVRWCRAHGKLAHHELAELLAIRAEAEGLLDLPPKPRSSPRPRPRKGCWRNWPSAASDAQFQAELARHFAERGNAPLAEVARTKARTLFEEKLAKEPENSTWAAELAEVLLIDRPGQWTILEPTQMKSEGGATLDLLDDGSILASGTNPDRDVYTVVARPRLKHIFAIRLEVLPHPSLPHNGPGRCPGDGNFYLNEFRVVAGGARVALSGVIVDYDEFKEAQRIIDGKIDGWAGWGNIATASTKNTAIVSTQLHRSPDDELRIELHSPSSGQAKPHALGRFRLSVSGDPAILDPAVFARERDRFYATKLTDPWAKLAAAYHVLGDQQALDSLLKHHPEAASRIADVYQSAGRTREAIPHLAKASAANPNDTLLSLKVAALQAWFGQEKELAATRQRILAFAKDTNDAGTAERAAKACSIRASTNKAELDAALALARKGVELEKGSEWREWRLLALGMAEYRSGNDAAANEALLAAVPRPARTTSTVTGTSAFYRAMSLFRQGKPDEARQLTIAAAAKMKPLPKDEQNPLAGDVNAGDYEDDLILWLAYKEAKALIRFDAPPAAPVQTKAK